eukprot:1160572-Pelagomonas_calceolata.AAC.6
MLSQFLPALCATVSSPNESGDTRFFCLRMVSEVRGAGTCARAMDTAVCRAVTESAVLMQWLHPIF